MLGEGLEHLECPCGEVGQELGAVAGDPDGEGGVEGADGRPGDNPGDGIDIGVAAEAGGCA